MNFLKRSDDSVELHLTHTEQESDIFTRSDVTAEQKRHARVL